MFSFQKSDHPVAIVRGNGELDGKIVFLHDDKNQNHISNMTSGSKFLELPLGYKMEHFPNIKKRDVLYITGSSGCGKTTIIGNYTRNFKRLFNSSDKDVILFRPTTTDDPALDDIELLKIPINDNLLDDKLAVEDLQSPDKQPRLVIFDDVEGILDNKLRKYVFDLSDQIDTCGRKNELYTIRINHLITDYKNTRTVLNEMTSLTLFPHDTSPDNAKYVLTKQFGMNRHQINELLNIPSRWITITRNFPKFVMYETGIKLLSEIKGKKD